MPTAQPPRRAGASSREVTPIILVGQSGFIREDGGGPIPSVIQLGIGKMKDDDECDMIEWIRRDTCVIYKIVLNFIHFQIWKPVHGLLMAM